MLRRTLPVVLAVATAAVVLPAASASAAYYPPPCPVRAIIGDDNGHPVLVVKDPTKPCAWIVIPVPVGA